MKAMTGGNVMTSNAGGRGSLHADSFDVVHSGFFWCIHSLL